jgi:hypothetical protein
MLDILLSTANSTEAPEIAPAPESSSKSSSKETTPTLAPFALPLRQGSIEILPSQVTSTKVLQIAPGPESSSKSSCKESTATLPHSVSSALPKEAAPNATKVSKHGLLSISEISRLLKVPTPPGSPRVKVVAHTPSKEKICLDESSKENILDVLDKLAARQDEKLRRLKALVHGETTRTWHKISQSFPGLTAEQCRDLYVVKVAPLIPRQDSNGNDVSKGDWTPQDHRLLLMAVELGRHKSWVDIAKGVPYKTPQQCRKYFHSRVKSTISKEDRFTLEECQNLLKISSRYGPNWVQDLEPVELDFILKNLFPKRTMRRLKECWNLHVYPAIMSYVAEKREAYGGGHPDAEIAKVEYEKDMNGLVSAALGSQGG